MNPVPIIRTSLPVAFGYIPMGMAFGMLLTAQGVDWWWASLMALFIFAGSAQYLAIGLLAAQAPLQEVFLATFFLNFRHVFYGLSLVERYKALGPWKWYAAFGLTDETFSLVSSQSTSPQDSLWIGPLTAVNHLWWMLGCTLGALVGSGLSWDLKGLEFALTALFGVLLVEQLRNHRDWYTLGGAIAAAGLSLWWGQGQNFLMIALILATGILMLRPARRNHGA